MHSLERADNWRSIIGNYTQQHSVCSILIIWNNVNVSMPEVLRSALGDKTRDHGSQEFANSLLTRTGPIDCLPHKYNCKDGYPHARCGGSDTSVLHWSGERKPWTMSPSAMFIRDRKSITRLKPEAIEWYRRWRHRHDAMFPPAVSARTTQPAANLRRSKRWFGIGYNFAILMAVTVLVLSVIAWRTNETADGA